MHGRIPSLLMLFLFFFILTEWTYFLFFVSPIFFLQVNVIALYIILKQEE